MTTKDEGIDLLGTYRTLDARLGLSLSDHVEQVLLARKVLPQEDILKASSSQ